MVKLNYNLKQPQDSVFNLIIKTTYNIIDVQYIVVFVLVVLIILVRPLEIPK